MQGKKIPLTRFSKFPFPSYLSKQITVCMTCQQNATVLTYGKETKTKNTGPERARGSGKGGESK